MMNNNIVNGNYIESEPQTSDKTINNKTYESNPLEAQIIKKLTSLEQVINTSIKKHGDKVPKLTRKK